MKLECVLFWYVCLFNQNTEETGVTSYKGATRNLTEKLTPEMRQSRFTVRGIEVSGKIKATVSNKAAANEVAQSLVSLGFTTLERDDIALALDEKALAQSGVTTGKDGIAESSQNPDILISGTLTGESPQKMRQIDRRSDTAWLVGRTAPSWTPANPFISTTWQSPSALKYASHPPRQWAKYTDKWNLCFQK